MSDNRNATNTDDIIEEIRMNRDMNENMWCEKRILLKIEAINNKIRLLEEENTTLKNKIKL